MMTVSAINTEVAYQRQGLGSVSKVNEFCRMVSIIEMTKMTVSNDQIEVRHVPETSQGEKGVRLLNCKAL